jgi:hypothetical protein
MGCHRAFQYRLFGEEMTTALEAKRRSTKPWIVEKCDGGQSASWHRAAILLARSRIGIGVMLNFARVRDRVWPLASLAVGLTFGVAWVGAFGYGLLTLLW